MWAMEERIVAQGSSSGVKLWNYIFKGSSILSVLIAKMDPESLGLYLLFVSQASKISMWMMNCSSRVNKLVMELGLKNARDFLSSV